MPSLLLYVSTNTDEVLPWGLFLNIGGHRDAESQLGSACPVTSGQSGQSRTRAAPPAAVRMEVMGSMPVVTLLSGRGSAFPVTDLCSLAIACLSCPVAQVLTASVQSQSWLSWPQGLQ